MCDPRIPGDTEVSQDSSECCTFILHEKTVNLFNSMLA